MINLTKKLARGALKEYYRLEDTFEARGTLFTNWDMHYIAAAPNVLWLSANMLNNKPLIIGFVQWTEINRIVVDQEQECVYIEFKDYDSMIEKTSSDFKLYKKHFSHQMSDTGLIAICLPLDLFSGNILPYLQEHLLMEFKLEPLTEKEKVRNTIITIILIIAFILIVLGFIL